MGNQLGLSDSAPSSSRSQISVPADSGVDDTGSPHDDLDGSKCCAIAREFENVINPCSSLFFQFFLVAQSLILSADAS
jgi:hypothetical protein